MDRRNYKSAKQDEPLLKSLVEKDLKYGFQMPILPSSLPKISYAVLASYSLIH